MQRGKLANSLHKQFTLRIAGQAREAVHLDQVQELQRGSARQGTPSRLRTGGWGRSDEFYWAADAEPHSRRRREILDKYGDKVRALYGFDHSTAVQVGEARPCKDWSTASGSKGSCRREGVLQQHFSLCSMHMLRLWLHARPLYR